MIRFPKRTFIKLLSVIAVSALCFSLMASLIYRYDNKYTRRTLQPIGGLLALSEKDLQENACYFLAEGWSFYPDKLFTPETYAGEGEKSFAQIITIGQYNDFSFGQPQRSTNGSATYRLLLSLPQTPYTYSLALPEVFSSYRLYIGGTLISELGDPSPEHYKPAVNEQVVTFTASGTTEVLLAVSNHSHYYSGLTYPPIFGGPSDVNRVLDIRLFLRIASISLILLIALAAFFFWLREHDSQQVTLLYFFACLCLLGYTAYPLITTFCTLDNQVWYALELLCLYGMYPLVIILQNKLWHLPARTNRFIWGFMALFCAAAMCYALLPTSSYTVHRLFELSARIIKMFTAAWLLINALLAAWHEEEKSMILLSGTTVFAAALVCDRIFPYYEPIYGGWFPEYGGVFLILCLGFIILKSLTDSYHLQLTLSEEKRQLTRQIAMQKIHYQELSEKIEDSIRRRHDERHHLKMICMLLENNEFDKLKEYLMDYHLSATNEERTVICTNLIVDAILQFYRHQCQEKQIALTLETDIPADIHISNTDLSVIFGNLLENAYEACLRQNRKDTYIHLAAHYRGGSLLLRIENSSDKPPSKKSGKFLSAKHDGYGIGTQSVKAAAARYGGQLKYDYNENFFRVSVILTEQTDSKP